MKRGVSVPKLHRPTSPLRTSDPRLTSSTEPKISKRKSTKIDVPVETPQEEEERKSNKYQSFLDEMMGVAIYVDYKVKKLMEKEIEHLRDMQEKLYNALLEKGKLVDELEMQNKSMQKQLQDVTMERDILRKKLEYEREYSRIILAIDEK